MLELTRQQVRQLRTLFKRLAPRGERTQPQTVYFQAGPDGLRVWCSIGTVALEWWQPGSQEPCAFGLPYSALLECDGSDRTPVTFSRHGEQVVVVWTSGSIPQHRAHPALSVEALPAVPPLSSMAGAPVFPALAEAASCAAADGLRFAMNCLQLRGATAEVAGTDGSQLLLYGGLPWPWKEKLIVPASRIFAAKELAETYSVAGASAEQVVLRTGTWTLYLKIETERRFPPVDEILPRLSTAAARLQLHPADAEFLADNLPQLPQPGAEDNRVTLHLNGQVVVRAKGESGPATELNLINSQPEGQELLLNLNRTLLERCLRLGFRDLRAWKKGSPMVAVAGERRFVWLPLNEDGVFPADPQAQRIDSPRATTAIPVTSSSPERRIMTSTAASSRPAAPLMAPVAKTPMDGALTDGQEPPVNLVQEAETLRNQLRDLLGASSRLLAEIKRQRRRTQYVRSTLQTLRQLQVAA